MKTRAKEKLDILRVRLARRFGHLDADLLLAARRYSVAFKMNKEETVQQLIAAAFLLCSL